MESLTEEVEIRDEESARDLPAEAFSSPTSPDTNDILGDIPVPPRIGKEFQVNVLPIATNFRICESAQSSNEKESSIDPDYHVQMGLPIPIMWVRVVADHFKHDGMKIPIGTSRKDSVCYLCPQNVKEMQTNPADNEESLLGDQKDEGLFFPSTLRKCKEEGSQDVHPLPGTSGEPWNAIEQEYFLLGLYIFGKNFTQIRRFVEYKRMGDILSYYYGKFYKSDKHRKWCECRKRRSRRYVHGQRIFLGWRQQELLTRLLPHISSELGNTLMEVSMTYNEGKLSLEEYVITLKTYVGLSTLVEAIGLGKGKRDLTRMLVTEPSKMNHVISARLEIPSGKACSSLSPADIIQLLTGDFRLSKARSNDLFWEAVWPRLLARGWHSEQPKDHAYVNSKHSLVFLVPGIKKFSRRKLVKGSHYFDSVADVLSKVASDSKLLELELEAVNGDGGTKDEFAWNSDAKLVQIGSLDHQRPCYLRPRVTNPNQELMKFTVVDTSMAQGEGPGKLRKLRNLPVERRNAGSPTSSSRKTDSDSSDGNVNGMMMDPNDREGSFETTFDTKKLKNNMEIDLDMEIDQTSMGISNPAEFQDRMTHDEHINRLLDDSIKVSGPNYLAPITKRQRINACGKSDRGQCSSKNSLAVHEVKDLDSSCSMSDLPEASDTVAVQAANYQQITSSGSSDKDSPADSGECVSSETESKHDRHESNTLFDLNLPHVPIDFETGIPFMSEVDDCQKELKTEEASVLSDVKRQTGDYEAMQTSTGPVNLDEPVVTARRQSTRNRPLTTRALEALANEFFSPKKRTRGTKMISQDYLMHRPARPRAQRNGRVSKQNSDACNVEADNLDPNVDAIKEECNRNTDGEPQIQSETLPLLDLLDPVHPPEFLTQKGHESG